MAKENPTPLPCPFCGSTPQQWEAGCPNSYFIGCKNKKCNVKPKLGTTHGENLAIAYWNHRRVAALHPEQVIEWAKRYDLPGSVTELRSMAEDIRTIEMEVKS